MTAPKAMLMAQGPLRPDRLITRKMTMREVAAAFAKVDREEAETIKIVLDIQADYT